MQKLHNKLISKIFLILIAILMLCNFAMPNYAYAVSTQQGGSALEPITKLLCFIPDVILNFLQKMFIYPDGIKNGEEYEIYYSPGIIFSGEVPALDVNFIKPKDNKIVKSKEGQGETIILLELESGADIDEDNHIMSTVIYKDENLDASDFYNRIINAELRREENEKNNKETFEEIFEKYGYRAPGTIEEEPQWIINEYKKIEGKLFYTYEPSITWVTKDGTIYKLSFIGELASDELIDLDQGNGTTKRAAVYKTKCYLTQTIPGDSVEYTSTSKVLQPIIATWYKVLRRITLVGLLSALVYIGIRMVLTSTSAKDKAKYKKMFKDWFVALCLLFLLHYMMILIVTVVGQINSIINVSSLGGVEEGEVIKQDVMLTSLRNRIANGSEWSVVLAEVVVYAVIVVYTIRYTIEYVKRVVYLAFLTMIAPLITLTYPLDKIKDSKAQAFDSWIKDYVFFNLLQVVHLLLYYIFVSSSMNMAEKGNWIYAIVVIGFLSKAEKTMKKMFGFEKSKSMGALTAAAAGGLAMKAISSLKKAPKQTGGGKENNSNGGQVDTDNTRPLRTAFTDDLSGIRAEQEEKTPLQRMADVYDEQMGTDNWDSQERDALAREAYGNSNQTPELSDEEYRQWLEDSGFEKEEIEQLMAERAGNSSNEEIDEKEAERIEKIIRRYRRIVAAKHVAQKYKGPAITTLKSTIRTVGGVALGAAGGTMGFAIGVAGGDVGKAITGAAGGMTAGYYTGQKLVNTAGSILDIAPNTVKSVKNVVNTYREGAYGEDYVQEIENEEFDSAFKQSAEYRLLKEEYRKLNINLSEKQLDQELGKNVDEMLNAGITDVNKMTKILRKHKKHPLRFSIKKGIEYTKLAEKCPNDILKDKQKFIRFFEDLNIEMAPEEIEQLRINIIEFK